MSVLGLVAGPWGWIVDAAGSVLSFCAKHWKPIAIAIAVALILGYTFMRGEKHNEAKWQKKEQVRLALETQIENEHQRQIAELDAAIEDLEKKAAQAGVARQAVYAEIDKRVKDYVAKHGAGVCGIDDDGMQLIRDAVRARIPRADQGR